MKALTIRVFERVRDVMTSSLAWRALVRIYSSGISGHQRGAEQSTSPVIDFQKHGIQGVGVLSRLISEGKDETTASCL